MITHFGDSAHFSATLVPAMEARSVEEVVSALDGNPVYLSQRGRVRVSSWGQAGAGSGSGDKLREADAFEDWLKRIKVNH